MEQRPLIKVLIVDDHGLIRTALRRLLEDAKGIKVIGEAKSGEDAISLARKDAPNVVLMDVKMPGIGGLEATRKLLRIDPGMRILIVTACDTEPFPSRLLQAGAAGYITKGSEPGEMEAAIRAVYAGKRYLSPEIAQALALRHLTEDDASPVDVLSERELQVMLMIANGQRVADIAKSLVLSPKTINSYRYRLFEKLGVETDVELTHVAIRYNLLDAPAMDASEKDKETSTKSETFAPKASKAKKKTPGND